MKGERKGGKENQEERVRDSCMDGSVLSYLKVQVSVYAYAYSGP